MSTVYYEKRYLSLYYTRFNKSFQNGLEKLSAEGIGVLAISVDPLEKAKETQKETGATFPIAYGVPVKETAEAVGAFYDAAPTHTASYIQSTSV
jgi:peroxiredoxin